MGLFGGGKVEESKGEKKLARVAKAQWADYKTRYKPVEDSFIEKARSLENEAPLATTRAIADTAQAYAPVRQRAETRMMTSGVNPNSGRFNAEAGGLGLRQASTAAKGTQKAQMDSQQRFLDSLTMAVKNGRDIASSANEGFRTSARETAQLASAEAADDEVRWQQNADVLGTAVGAGASTYAPQLKNAWQTGSTFATQSGSGSWGDPLARPRRL